ncbi:MAG: 30S ribosomal protein S7 [Chloroflexota bacterium]
MSRRYQAERRDVEPDMRYENMHISMFISRMMKNGKRSTAQRILYDSLALAENRAKRPAIELFEQALRNVSPQIEVKPRRVGGATYQVPMQVEAHRQISLAIRWILLAARKRGGRSMAERLSAELLDAANNQGAAVKKKDDTHRMAEANRAFAHYRF